MDAVAVEALLGKLLDKNDLRGDEDGGLALLVGNRDFDEGLGIVVFVALEAQTALGHVFADDHVIAAVGMADAGRIFDFDARVLAAIGAREGRLFRGRESKNSGALRGQWGKGFGMKGNGGVERGRG